MTEKAEKLLRVATAPVPGSDDTELELTWGTRELGSLTLHPDDFAEFVEALRAGFRVVISSSPSRQARRDVAEFAADIPDADEQDD